MTLNERLAVAGLLTEFDEAARARHRERMIELLVQVGVDGPEWSVDVILRNPGRYGF